MKSVNKQIARPRVKSILSEILLQRCVDRRSSDTQLTEYVGRLYVGHCVIVNTSLAARRQTRIILVFVFSRHCRSVCYSARGRPTQYQYIVCYARSTDLR